MTIEATLRQKGVNVEERARTQLRDSAQNLLSYRKEGRAYRDYNFDQSRHWFYCLAHVLQIERLSSERGDTEAFWRFAARMAAES